ncbi:hypothetical protein TH62_11400 [Bacillus sp. TH008]|nr:hypothetical protein TH62_11400 [Bacillus sp. TH008]
MKFPAFNRRSDITSIFYQENRQKPNKNTSRARAEIYRFRQKSFFKRNFPAIALYLFAFLLRKI